MKVDNRIFAAFLVCAASAAIVPAAAMAAETSPPAASVFYPLIGDWKGNGSMVQPGEQPIALSISLSCAEASAGWAVSCVMVAKNDDITITESDLFGVDPVTGQGHWYTVSNQGETHDHLATWMGKTLTGDYSWVEDGKKMHEHIVLNLSTDKSMDFRGVTTADGQEAGTFTGELTR